MKRAHIYLRVSTEEQDLEAQLQECLSYCMKQGYAVVGVFRDQGYSRDTIPAKRPGFGQLLEQLESGDLIVVYHRDRLGEGIPLAILERDLERMQVFVENTKGAGNGQSLEDKLHRRMVDAFSEYEHGRIKARVRDSLAAKRAHGLVYCGRLYGHAKQDGRFVEHEEEQQVLSSIAEMRRQGYSLPRIAEELTAQGIPSPRGNRHWAHSTVRKILRRLA